MRITLFYVVLLLYSTSVLAEDEKSYKFDSQGISRSVLENYLSRAITLTELLEKADLANDGAFPGKEDDLRLIRNIGAKFIGRAIYRWGREDMLNNPEFLGEAKRIVHKIHETDPDVVLQAALFEIVTTKVNEIRVPAWVFEAYEIVPEDRSFRYEDMLNTDGKFVDHWRKECSVPDISRTETQLWFLFLAGVYMDIGCEAFHLGQVNLMGMNDPGWKHWKKTVDLIRKLARDKSRRDWILLDAHTPSGGMVVDETSLLDFNSFPLRIKETIDKPQKCILEVGYLDGLYGRSLGCVTPSGWRCDSLPYLVEFDNFGITRSPGQATVNSHFVWGYDEISWFHLQSEEYRKEWLKYAHRWLRDQDPNGFLQMPVGRIVITDRGQRSRFRANTRSESMPQGQNLEETIMELFHQ